MAEEEREAIIQFLVGRFPGRFPGNVPSEEDIRGVALHPKSYGYEGAKAGADTPLEKFKKELRDEVERGQGIRVADHFMRSVAGLLVDVPDELVAQARELPYRKLAIEKSDYLEAAIDTDRKERRKEFEELARRSYLTPLVVSSEPQDKVTLAAIDRHIGKWADNYEQQYHDGIRAGLVFDRSLMGRVLEEEALRVMSTVRPDLSPSNLDALMTKIILQESVRVAVAGDRVVLAAEKSYDRYRKDLETKLDAAMIALGDDPTGLRAQLSAIRWNDLADPGLREEFVAMAKAGPINANEYLDAQIGGLVASAAVGTGFEGAVAKDLAGTLAGIRKAPGEQVTAKRLEEDTALFMQKFQEQTQERSEEFMAALGETAEGLLERAGGKPVGASSLLSEAIAAANRKVKAESGVAGAKEKAEGYGVAANQALQLESPDVMERLRARFGGDPAAMVFQLAGGDPVRAKGLLEHEIKVAGQEVGRAAGYRDMFSADAGFEQAKVSPRLQQLMAQGGYLNEQDVGELTGAHRFSGAFSNMLSADEGGTPEERAGRLTSFTSDLWKQAGGDLAKFEKARQAAFSESPEVEQARRSTLPNYGQAPPSFDLPAGGLGGRASLAFQHGQLPYNSPQAEDLRRRIGELDAKEALAAKEAEQRRNPLPRGRKM